MKVFTCSCKDNITGMEILASDLSHNEASQFLESKVKDVKYAGLDSMVVGDNHLWLSCFESARRKFCYDETRQVLLGE